MASEQNQLSAPWALLGICRDRGRPGVSCGQKGPGTRGGWCEAVPRPDREGGLAQRRSSTNKRCTHRRIPGAAGGWRHELVVRVALLAVVQSLSRVRTPCSPWTVTPQAPLSMGFPRQEYWSGLPFPSPGHLPAPGIGPGSPESAGGFFTLSRLGSQSGPYVSRSVLSDSATPWTVAHQAPLSTGFPRLEGKNTGVGCCSVAQSCLTLCDPMDAAHQISLSFTVSQSLLKLTSLESAAPPSRLVLSLVLTSSCSQSCPASGSFPRSQFFPSSGQSIGASASASASVHSIE